MNHQPLVTLIVTISAGILSLILASKIRLPSIFFLLIFGVFLGPEFANLIQPDIFHSEFPDYISLMVALILFEGGASLKFSQFREISSLVRNLLTIGVIITLVLVCFAARMIVGFSWLKSVLFGAIMIVTGPTVVLPILQRIRVKENLHNILKWEAILIDPLGVVISVVLFEFLLAENMGFLQGMGLFVGRFGIGVLLGFLAGWFMCMGLSKNWLLKLEGEELGGLFVLGLNLLFFGVSEWILPESGLVTVTVAGIYLGNHKYPFQEQIFHFKKQITLFALSILFILLASNVPVRSIQKILLEGTMLVFLMIFLIRPLSVFLSTWRDKKLTFREKGFLAFLAPRGIVSASMASFFALSFEERALTERGIFLPLAFHVIAGTIFFYALFAGWIARILRVTEDPGQGILIVGASPLGLLLGEEFQKRNYSVKFIDTNSFNCYAARKKGFSVYEGSGFDREFLESLDLKGIGTMIAVTPNHEVNVLSCQTFSRYLGRKAVFRLWDKTDNWSSVTDAAYDGSWGKPFLIPATDKNSELMELIQSGQFEPEIKRLGNPIKISEEGLSNINYQYPVIAFKEKTFSILSAGAEATLENDILFLTPK